MTLDSEAVKTKTSISNITSARALQWYNGKQILRTQESDPMEQQGVQESVFMLLPFWVGRGKVKILYFPLATVAGLPNIGIATNQQLLTMAV